ncbi:hypothetical protein MPTK1_2g20150 [Marchantia polymorpha subsp. ruderalis]|uniref:Uncharacterized protein n=1 Tax=Marchantia polymorpha TaxID=3197 RepID=A0A2R6WV91_MARPO|nr:hypothetical protein MARPO_0055s0031 [Marchantia polymorpha]PTQ37756.1 hypothetical protein MARPO_0055s0035 [Marchantia polymorpha]BBN03032.1 hypothetical protein Mp_2g20150 [Marchantia polymorpha subsp. ruderalis]|eukprot:PTQ37752.1 hypothetical protein MARPO_0055s0031 [Marchantia polymorpha]
MDATRTIAALLHALLFSVACVEGKAPRLYPATCAHLMPKPCKPVFSMDEENRTTLESYSELCLHHECITIRANAAPVNPKPSFCFMNCPQVSGGPPSNDSAPHRPHPHPHPPPEAGHLNSKSAFFRVAEKRFQYLSAQNSSVAKFADPALFKEDSEGRVSRATTNTWFCDETMIKFKARVEAATGMVAGQKEDEYAHCEWMRFGSFLDLTNCYVTTHPCIDCLKAYRFWLCGVTFPKCDFGPHSKKARGLTDQKAGDMYLRSGNYTDEDYVITKPCRGLCFDVTQKCTIWTEIQCHKFEDREYGDPPTCNGAGRKDRIIN